MGLLKRNLGADEDGRGMGWLERAEWFFACLFFFAGFFYLAREAKTDLQWYFRVVSFFVGLLGRAAVQLIKRSRS